MKPMLLFPQSSPVSDDFQIIEMFSNPKRKHTNNGMLSPVEFERQQKLKHQGVWKISGISLGPIRWWHHAASPMQD